MGIIPFPNLYVGKYNGEDNNITGKWYYNNQEVSKRKIGYFRGNENSGKIPFAF